MAEQKVVEIIIISNDETRRQQLQNKLVEYRKRINLRFPIGPQMNTAYKIIILERLLRDGQVKISELVREMSEIYANFNIDNFRNVCVIIDDYCKTGGQNLFGGTGLPASEIELT